MARISVAPRSAAAYYPRYANYATNPGFETDLLNYTQYGTAAITRVRYPGVRRATAAPG